MLTLLALCKRCSPAQRTVERLVWLPRLRRIPTSRSSKLSHRKTWYDFTLKTTLILNLGWLLRVVEVPDHQEDFRRLLSFSPLSIVIVDNVERLLEYSPIGNRYSNMVLQTLLILISKAPPKKCRLMILATSSNQEFLSQVGMLGLFTRVIHVPRISSIAQILKVLEECDFTSQETKSIGRSLEQSGYK